MSQSYSKSFVKDNAIVIAGHALMSLKSIILLPIIIKTVGVTIYGGYILIGSILGFAMGISSFGVGFKMTRFLPSAKDMMARRDLFYPQFFFQISSILLLSLLLILLDGQIKQYIFKNEVTYCALILGFYLVCYFLYGQGVTYFRYTSRITCMTLGGLLSPCLHIGFVLLFWYFSLLSINALVLSAGLSSFLIAIPCFCVIFREIGLTIPSFDIKKLISDIKLGLPLVMNFIVDFVLSGSDRYVIALFLSITAVGYYNPAYTLGSIIVFIPKAMGTVIPQLLSRSVDNDEEHEARRMVNYAIKIFLLIAIPFVFGSAVLGKSILTLLATSEVADKACLITPIVALGTLFYGLNCILSNVLYVRLRTYAMFGMNIFASAFNLIINLIFIYLFKSIIVAAISTFLSYFIVFIYIYRAVSEDWNVDLQPASIVKSVIASSVMFALLSWVSFNFRTHNTVGMLFVELVMGIVVYFAVLLTLGTFSKKELRFIKSFVYR